MTDRDPNDITDEPRKWFKATEEWLDARLALSSVASERSECERGAELLRKRAADYFIKGHDLQANLLRQIASEFDARERVLDAERLKRLKEKQLIDTGYGPIDIPD
jgi:hypothetical protein